MELREFDEKNKYKFSENKIFALKQPNPVDIFIKIQHIETIRAQNPKFFDKYLFEIRTLRGEDHFTKNKKGEIIYKKFTTTKSIEIKHEKNDCLKFAEKISLNDADYDLDNSVFSVESDKSKRKFGVSDKQNSEIVRYTRNYYIKKHPKHNIDVNPDIGDAYAMVPHEIPLDKGVCPYHAASVIFKDGETNITLEADAGIKTAKPIFDMYSTTKPRHTFYASHMPTYLLFDDKKSNFKIPTALHLRKSIIIETKSKTSKSHKAIDIQPIRRSSRLKPVEEIKSSKSSKSSIPVSSTRQTKSNTQRYKKPKRNTTYKKLRFRNRRKLNH
tara:strand:+ start:3184 stop:4167 length:984 start_codon:yes stop_codon:yes gene_type:complete